VEDGETISLFAFLEFHTNFVPRHGDVMCIRAKDIFHCTRVLKKRQQLGLAFFQKASLFRQLKKVLDAPNVTEFEVKKNAYQKALDEGTLSLIDF